MSRTRKKALWLAAETTYSTDSSASGAGYLPLPVDKAIELIDKKAPLETEYQHGENWDSALEEGPDGWELSGVEIPLTKNLTLAADGVDASTITDDYLDLILTHILGLQETTVGETVTGVTSATNLVLATDLLDIHEVFPLTEAGVPTQPRTQWNKVTADNGAGDYDITPGFSDYGTAPPTTAAIAHGVKRYSFDDNGGPTMAFVFRDDGQDYTLLGGRCTSWKIVVPPGGKRIKLITSWRGDRKIAETKASLPAALVAPATTPLRGVLAPLWFNGTQYHATEITIEGGTTAQVIESTAGAEGRVGDEHAMQKPTVTMDPQFSNAINDLKRNAGGPQKGGLLIQLGATGLAVYIDQAQPKEVTRKDAGNVARQMVNFHVSTPGIVGGAAPYKFQIVRV